MGESSGEGGLNEQMQHLFERFSLTGSEARILAALIRLGMGTARQLAEMTNLNRQNVYPVLDLLRAKDLVERLPGSVGTWTTPGRDEVVGRLERSETQRLADAASGLRVHSAEIRALLSGLPDNAERDGTGFRIVEKMRLAHIYEDSMVNVRKEILVFNRGPYPGELTPSPLVLDALARGVEARALYRRFELVGAAGSDLRLSSTAYAKAGVGCRVADDLPLSVAILDRAVALVSAPADGEGEADFPTNVVIENRSLAGLLAEAFDHIWDRSIPYDHSVDVRHTAAEASTSAKPLRGRRRAGATT